MDSRGQRRAGDALRITIWDADGASVRHRYIWTVMSRGSHLPCRLPLDCNLRRAGPPKGQSRPAAIGLIYRHGHRGGDISMRGILQEPFPELGGQPSNILMMPTPGDMIVAINAEIHTGSGSGAHRI